MSRLLVADIGATNARFSLAEDAGLCGPPLVLPTAAYATSDALLGAAVAGLGGPPPAAVCLAVAGPVVEGRGRITNGGMTFDAPRCAARLEAPVTLINDFHALARALPDLRDLRRVGGSAHRAAPAAVKAVVGPGSGLGMGLLVPRGAGWQVLASEGGHADLAPGSALEAEVLALLQAEHGHVSWETVLSGSGLVRLYRVVCRIWGMAPEPLEAEAISALGAQAHDPVCHQTLELFFALLGAAAGNLALTACAFGGVYIGGGIVPTLADFAAASPMRRRFDERGPMSELIGQVPLSLVLDPHPGLIGALACLRETA